MERVNLTDKELNQIITYGPRFQKIGDMIVDSSTKNYYNREVEALIWDSQIEAVTEILNVVDTLLKEVKEELSDKLAEMKKDIIEDLTPAAAKRGPW